MSSMKQKQVVETHKNISQTIETLVSFSNVNDGCKRIPENEMLVMQQDIGGGSQCSKRTRKEKRVRAKYKKNRQMRMRGDISLDDSWIGNAISKLNTNTVRLWSQNVNGVDIGDNFNEYMSMLDSCADYDIGLLALQETHVNVYNNYVNENIHACHKMASPEGHLCMSNTFVASGNDCKQRGGVLMSVNGSLAHRVSGMGKDVYGRFVWMDFYGKESYLRIYNIYRVNSDTDDSAGDGSAWTHQRIQLLKHNIETNPREAVINALFKAIQQDVKMGRDVVVMGDMNENVIQSQLQTKFADLGLRNVVSELIVPDPKVRSCSKGSNIIDGIWVSNLIFDNIISCGLSPFEEVIVSDHRGIYIDINIKQILDAVPLQLQIPPYRRLKSTVFDRVSKYGTYVREKWSNHRIASKIKGAEETFKKFGANEDLVRIVNSIDLEIQQILMNGEKNCCKVGRHCNLLFSRELAEILKDIKFWKKERKRFFRLGVPKQSEFSEIQQNLRAARKRKKDYAKEQVTKREEFLQQKIDDLAKFRPGISEKGKLGLLKSLKNVERQQRDAKKIKYTLKGANGMGTSFVLIPDTDQYERHMTDEEALDVEVIWPRVQIANGRDVVKWKRIDDPLLVEKLILGILRKHFEQSNTNNVTDPIWRNKLKQRDVQEKLLKGEKVEWEATDPAIFDVTDQFRKHPNMQQIPFQLDFEEFCHFVKKVKEKKSVSPSKRHYGHYKALLFAAEDVLEDVFKLMNLSVQMGVVLERYQHTVTTILKKEHHPYIHRFRPIHIIEAELQYISKSQWARKMIMEAEKLGIITDSQYGGRRGRQAQSAVLNSVLYYDINRQNRTDFTSNDDDLRANYDRELPFFVAAENRKVGITYEAGEYLQKVLQGQKYYVRSQQGVSKTSYTYDENKPIWGLGQGIGWAGACWQITASTIDECMKNKCVGMFYSSPDGKITVSKMMDFFIDDTKKGCNISSANGDLLEQTRANMQYHLDIVRATGGDLALDKCHFYYIKFKFNSKGEAYMACARENPGALQINCPITGKEKIIKRLDPHESHKTLGYWISPDGKGQKLANVLVEMARDWKHRINASTLNPSQILLAYKSVLERQLVYRLVATSLSFDQCDKVMQQISPTLLHALHVQEHFPRVIMESDHIYAGFGLTHLYDIHGHEKLKFLLFHLRKKDTTGKLLWISAKITQLEVGCEHPFWNLDYNQYSSLASASWVTHLWEYLFSKGLEMDCTEKLGFTKQREYDKCLMDIAVQHFSGQELVIINKMRIALQVIYLSDITMLNGKLILPNIMNGENLRKSLLRWPKQTLLKSWVPIWKKACQFFAAQVGGCNLGRWYTTHQKWNWFTNEKLSHVKSGTNIYARVSNRKRYRLTNEYEDCCILADVALGNTVSLLSHGMLDERVCTTQYNTRWRKQLFGRWDLHSNDDIIKTLLLKNKLILGLDGSVTNEKGAYAFGLADYSGKVWYKFHGPTHGDHEQQHSTRSELMGILGGLLYLNEFCEKHELGNVKNISVMVCGDNIASLELARRKFICTAKNSFDSDVDVILEIRAVLKRTPISFKFQWVPAHQDDSKPFQELDSMAKINVQMDQYVKQYFTQPDNHLKDKLMIPFMPAQVVSIRNKYWRVVSKFQQNIQRYKLGHEAERQCAKTWGIALDDLKNMEWYEFRSVLSNATASIRYQYVKAIHRQWPVMSREFKWGKAECPKCPLCGKTEETWLHVLQCDADPVQIFRQQQLTTVRNKLMQIQTEPLLLRHLMRILTQLLGDFDVVVPGMNIRYKRRWNSLFLALQFQQKLGFHNLFFGILTSQIGLYQHANMQEKMKQSKIDISQWKRTVIRSLLSFTVAIWKFRCDLVAKTEQCSMESRTREIGLKLLTSIKAKKWVLGHENQHLLNRSDGFFEKGLVRDIRAWCVRIQLAMDRAQSRWRLMDIRQFVTKIRRQNNSYCHMDDESVASIDSDSTAQWIVSYPDEDINTIDTWDRIPTLYGKQMSSCVNNGKKLVCTSVAQQVRKKKEQTSVSEIFTKMTYAREKEKYLEQINLYDSDATDHWYVEYPDEDLRVLDTWDRLKKIHSTEPDRNKKSAESH